MADDSLLDFEDDDFVSADLNHDDGSDDDAPEQSTAEPPPDSDAAPPDGDSKQPVLSKFLKGKEREWEAVAQLPGPLTLLKLPVDILHLIVKEVTHTNDLTALALTNSSFYDLAIPHIYARFDIVWPDTHVSTSDAKSVDALTYGLSTLCLGSTFARTTHRLRRQGLLGPPSESGPRAPKFGGADYAKFTRKFSLGNGPADWVTEYLISKESGKMLGTLVALAVAKMVNLETFVWDMPTGVLSDIFMALASLSDYSPDEQCKLERLWIRWHDNTGSAGTTSSNASPIVPTIPPQAVVPLGSTLTPIGIMLPSTATHPKPREPIPYSASQVEYPTFSVLPPLKSLSVVDIDELAYLDEISVLVERSKDRLQELRIGVSTKAQNKDFVQIWDGPDLQQVDHEARWPGESSIGERRLGGVLGVLVGRIYDIRRKPGAKPKSGTEQTPAVPEPAETETAADAPQPEQTSTGDAEVPAEVPTEVPTAATDGAQPAPSVNASSSSPPPATTTSAAPSSPPRPFQVVEVSLLKASPAKPSQEVVEPAGRKRLEGRLKLHTLELERIPLSMQVCSKAIDWAALTNLTILDCSQHENLWKLLKRQFQPTPLSSGMGIPASASRPSALQYQLNLKRIHTDITSAPLIAFIKETLAPNTLEVLFLQDRRRNSAVPPVTLSTIFKGAIKRHRASLGKLLLDSSLKPNNPPTNTDNASTRWRQWALNLEVLLYVTSGRMAKLRELAVCLRYSDWHTFLQRLPNIPQLRSLHIPNLADHAIQDLEQKELALQIGDIVTLRPEIQLCYIGIGTKCFEILETTHGGHGGGGGHGGDGGGPNGVMPPPPPGAGEFEVVVVGPPDDGTVTSSSDDSDDDDGDDASVSDVGDTPGSQTDPDETQSEDEDGAASDDDSSVEDGGGGRGARGPRLRLREILFYDDKVAIFKARHGRL